MGELADIAAESIFQVPFPVASAIMLPPCLKPSIESIRSGTVIKAKDPIQVIMRGTAMTMSLDSGPMGDVVLDGGAMVIFEVCGLCVHRLYLVTPRRGIDSDQS